MSNKNSKADDEDFVRFVLDFESRQPQVESYRPSALNTQHTEDRITSEYREFIKRLKVQVTKELDDTASDDEVDDFCFPPAENGSFDTLYRSLRSFLNYIVSYTTPRASLTKQTITPSYLKTYRSTLVKIVDQGYKKRRASKRSVELPDPDELRGEINKVLGYLVRYYNLETNPDEEKTYLGAAEIAYLIDIDSQTTKSIALSECHHLAWTLARACALRPGSLGPLTESLQDPKVKLPFLTFGDCRIQRADDRFELRIKIRNLKTNNGYDFDRILQNNGKLKFTVLPPLHVKHFCLSPTLRILAIALRRNALKMYTSVEELLNGDEQIIEFKDEFLDKPVMLQGTERGLAVTDQPARSHSFTRYLGSRAVQAGFIDEVTFYSIRRKTASDWARAYGNDTTRMLMGHSANSKGLEQYYLDTVRSTDVSAVALNQGSSIDVGTIDENILYWERLSPSQLEDAFTKQIPLRLEQLKQEQGDEYQKTSGAERKNIDRVLQRQAVFDIMKQVRADHLSTLKASEVKSRKEAILSHETAFNRRLLELAQQQQCLSEEPVSVDRRLLQEDVLALDESQANPSPKTTTFLTELSKVPYQAGLSITLTMLLENSLSEVVLYRDGQCPLCLADPTVSAEDKAKFWEKGKLKRHIEGQQGKASFIHGPKKAFERLCASIVTADNKWVCPYCVRIAPPGAQQVTYVSQKEVNAHIRKSDGKQISGNSAKTTVRGRQIWATSAHVKQHEELKTAEGWYDPNFSYGLSSSNVLQAARYKYLEVTDESDNDFDDMDSEGDSSPRR